MYAVIGIIVLAAIYLVIFTIPLWFVINHTNNIHGLEFTIPEVIQLMFIILIIKIIPTPKEISDVIEDIKKNM